MVGIFPLMIHHFGIPVPRRQKSECVDFYTALGFTEVEPPAELRGGTVWLERNGAQVHLMLRDEASVPVLADHVAIVVPDLDHVLAALDQLGVAADRRREYWGSPRYFVRDPLGNKLELMGFAPGG